MTENNTIEGIVSLVASGLSEQLWGVAAIAVPIAIIFIGVPLGMRLLKRVAK